MNAPLVLRKAGLFIWDYLPRHYPIFKRQCNQRTPRHTHNQSSKSNAINRCKCTLTAIHQSNGFDRQSKKSDDAKMYFSSKTEGTKRDASDAYAPPCAAPAARGIRSSLLPNSNLFRNAFDHLFYPLLIYFEMHSIISLPTSTLF